MIARSEELNELAKALAGAQSEFGAVPKGKVNTFFDSRYADLATVVKAAAPIISKYGLSVSQWPGRDNDGRDILTTWLLHTSGQFIAEAMPLHLAKDRETGQVKEDSQTQGSAMTYARRYSYMSVLGLVADEDDDGNRASSGPGPARAAAPAPAPAQEGEPLVTEGQARLLYVKSKHLSQQDREAVLSHVAGVTELEKVPKRLVDEAITAFTRPIPTGQTDLPVDTSDFEPAGAAASGNPDDDIPF